MMDQVLQQWLESSPVQRYRRVECSLTSTEGAVGIPTRAIDDWLDADGFEQRTQLLAAGGREVSQQVDRIPEDVLMTLLEVLHVGPRRSVQGRRVHQRDAHNDVTCLFEASGQDWRWRPGLWSRDPLEVVAAGRDGRLSHERVFHHGCKQARRGSWS